MQATMRAPAKTDTFTVTYGGDELEMPVGASVGATRNALADHLGIPPNAQPRVNGKPVSDSDVPPRGVTLEFVKEAGVKG